MSADYLSGQYVCPRCGNENYASRIIYYSTTPARPAYVAGYTIEDAELVCGKCRRNFFPSQSPAVRNTTIRR